MSALAQILSARGCRVSGSDRNLDRGINQDFFQKLSRQGIRCLPQDGSGIDGTIDIVAVSSAVEEDNPDVKKAREKAIPVVNRATLLAVLFNGVHGIAVAGTNGKTTVTGMISWVLDQSGLDPIVVVGGIMKNYAVQWPPGNARMGGSGIMVIEADESDGSLIYYGPKTGVITGIAKDHKPLEELLKLFITFAQNSEKLVLNADCPVLGSVRLPKKEMVTYGLGEKASIMARDLVCRPEGSSFKIGDVEFALRLPGRHNVMNALAAVATCHMIGVPLKDTVKPMGDFLGIRRRLDLVGERGGIRVIDDFAHNPQKIRASLNTVKLRSGRVLAVYQPHGYGPTRFLRDELVESFAQSLSPEDVLYMPEIFYAGGTAKKDVSSRELIDELTKRGIRAFFFPERGQILEPLIGETRPGDTILIMGARDDTLTDFCQEVLHSLSQKYCTVGA